jgi:uncharacterized protein (DUF302 family)
LEAILRKVFLIVALFFGTLLTAGDVVAFKVDTSKHKVTPQSVEAAFSDAGFAVQSNNDLAGAFKNKFKYDGFNYYHLLVVYYPKTVKALINNSIHASLFEPFTIVIYQRKGSSVMHTAYLDIEARTKLTAVDNKLAATQTLKTDVANTLKKALVAPTPYSVNFSLDTVAEGSKITEVKATTQNEIAVDFKDEFEGSFEENVEGIGFIMANFLDLAEDMGEEYIFFDVYSLCKLSILYGMVDAKPEVGILAPCTLVVYQKKGSNELVVAYADVKNWIKTFQISDKKGQQFLHETNKEILRIIHSSLAGVKLEE